MDKDSDGEGGTKQPGGPMVLLFQVEYKAVLCDSHPRKDPNPGKKSVKVYFNQATRACDGNPLERSYPRELL